MTRRKRDAWRKKVELAKIQCWAGRKLITSGLVFPVSSYQLQTSSLQLNSASSHHSHHHPKTIVKDCSLELHWPLKLHENCLYYPLQVLLGWLTKLHFTRQLNLWSLVLKRGLKKWNTWMWACKIALRLIRAAKNHTWGSKSIWWHQQWQEAKCFFCCCCGFQATHSQTFIQIKRLSCWQSDFNSICAAWWHVESV